MGIPTLSPCRSASPRSGRQNHGLSPDNSPKRAISHQKGEKASSPPSPLEGISTLVTLPCCLELGPCIASPPASRCLDRLRDPSSPRRRSPRRIFVIVLVVVKKVKPESKGGKCKNQDKARLQTLCSCCGEKRRKWKNGKMKVKPDNENQDRKETRNENRRKYA